jgi:DNA replication ATP-dependent helicase Dna2
LDETQREVFLVCLRQPPALAVQGPPGTGKTLLLACVAEALARRGRRVVIMAPKHQAVNNALSTIHSRFPGRSVLKVGDALRREALDDCIPVGLLDDATKAGLRLSHETITGMTFLSALQQLALRNAPLAPNVVIIDEAGQLPLAQGACAGLMGAGSMLMFGDDMQMPPVFASEVAGDPLSVSVFARFRERHPGLVPMLDMTYRLNDVLCRAIGETFYAGGPGGRLRPSAHAATRRLDAGVAAAAGGPLVAQALDPASPLVWARSHSVGCTHLNIPEARFVAEVLETAIAGGLAREQVAAVTPFRRQAMQIRDQLQARLGSGTRLPIVDTVERVQGATVELVALSACATDPDYVASLGGFLLSPNRLNVAASRARTKVVLAASPVVLAAIRLEYDALVAQGVWRAFMAHAGTVLDQPG